MAILNSNQGGEVTFLTGVNAGGTVVAESFWTWNNDRPATYGSSTYASKWGSSTPGTGATISYMFDSASNWTSTEKAAFVSSMKLWSAVANVTFVEAGTASANFTISRASDGSASGGVDRLRPTSIGSNRLGTSTLASIDIDTSSSAFGPIGSTFSNYGGYPWMTMLHEMGHVLGLGHGGPYDEGVVENSQFGSYDTRTWTIMSYNNEATSSTHNWGTSLGDDGLRYRNVPTTWMPLDIVAIQRLYGVAVNTPLSGGQTFGFNSNIQGEIANYFNFNLNSKPIVTLWSAGGGNTLDLSGFSTVSTVDLHDGAFSSAAGLVNNIAIAFGTRIDGLVTGGADDRITGNDNGNVIQAGAGADLIEGGAGNDHLYGGGMTAVAGDGNDTINGGAGSDYIQGNAGNDRLDGGDGSDRIQGGQGNDSITGGAGNDSINGNLGNDSIDGGDGNDSLRGGQGDDSILGGAGDDILLGDLGQDTLIGGAGIDVMTGGGDADLFVFAAGDARIVGGGTTDVITDFTDGADRIRLAIGVPMQVLHAAAFTSFADATAAAQSVSGSTAAAYKVGSDTYVFYAPNGSAGVEAIKLAGFANDALITAADFA